MAAVTFTRHARERMEERRVTLHDVIRVLAFGEPAPTRRPAVYRSRIPRSVSPTERQTRDRVNDVVVVYQHGDESDEFTVVTVYRDEQQHRTRYRSTRGP